MWIKTNQFSARSGVILILIFFRLLTDICIIGQFITNVIRNTFSNSYEKEKTGKVYKGKEKEREK